jgi:hypothetical protein
VLKCEVVTHRPIKSQRRLIPLAMLGRELFYANSNSYEYSSSAYVVWKGGKLTTMSSGGLPVVDQLRLSTLT